MYPIFFVCVVVVVLGGVVAVMRGQLAGAAVPPVHTLPTDNPPLQKEMGSPSSFLKPGHWGAVGRL